LANGSAAIADARAEVFRLAEASSFGRISLSTVRFQGFYIAIRTLCFNVVDVWHRKTWQKGRRRQYKYHPEAPGLKAFLISLPYQETSDAPGRLKSLIHSGTREPLLRWNSPTRWSYLGRQRRQGDLQTLIAMRIVDQRGAITHEAAVELIYSLVALLMWLVSSQTPAMSLVSD
jgi:hypothetical protein